MNTSRSSRSFLDNNCLAVPAIEQVAGNFYGISPEVRRAWNRHIVNCRRCNQIYYDCLGELEAATRLEKFLKSLRHRLQSLFVPIWQLNRVGAAGLVVLVSALSIFFYARSSLILDQTRILAFGVETAQVPRGSDQLMFTRSRRDRTNYDLGVSYLLEAQRRIIWLNVLDRAKLAKSIQFLSKAAGQELDDYHKMQTHYYLGLSYLLSAQGMIAGFSAVDQTYVDQSIVSLTEALSWGGLIKDNPTYRAECLFYLGKAYEMKKDFDRARKHFQEVRDLYGREDSSSKVMALAKEADRILAERGR